MNPNRLEVPVQVRLAALWASTMFLYVYVDILSLYKPGTVRDILRGRCGSSRSPRDRRLARSR